MARAAGQRVSGRLRGVAIAVGWLFVWLGAVLFSGGLWVRHRFGVISVDQLLFNLRGAGGDGAGGVAIVWNAAVFAVLLPTALVVACAWLLGRSLRDLRAAGVLGAAGAGDTAGTADAAYAGRATQLSRRRGLLRAIAAVVVVAVPLTGAGYFGASVGVRDFLESYAREAGLASGIADYYVAPELGGGAAGGSRANSADVGDGPAAPQNLIVVYLESIENTFADETVFERNMLAPLQEATAGWAEIPRLRQYEGGGWTMSGVVATQCGIPLRTAANLADPASLNQIGAPGEATVDAYLPGATCLGDVLGAAGYRSVFMGGALATFAGKGTFLTTHGYDEVYDLQHWINEGETETRDWGLSDRRLFELARTEVQRLHDADAPFNLTLLTLDTHDPENRHPYCSEAAAPATTAMTAITECSLRQVAGFVGFLGESGILEDTAVVLMGDHNRDAAPANAFWEELRDRQDRTLFNRVWVPGGVEFARADVDQFALFPTLLDLAGVSPASHRAGIGVSALVTAAAAGSGSPLTLDPDDYAALVTSRAPAFYQRLWSGH